LSSNSTTVEAVKACGHDMKKAISDTQDIKKSYLKLKEQLSGFMGAVGRLEKGLVVRNSEDKVVYSKNDLMQYVTLGRKILAQIRKCIIQFVAGVHKSLNLAKRSDEYHNDQKKYFDGKGE
jgi:hypothetical protein